MLNRTKNTFRRKAPREEGQALLLFVMAMTFAFMIGAIVVDVGLIVSERRNAQVAADLAALAAASKLGDSNAETIALGQEFAARNGYDNGDAGVDVVVTPQYNSNPELVEVTVSGNSPALFRGIFNAVGLDVGARAVATAVETVGSPSFPALFAISTNCSGTTLEISGSENLAVGLVHSNGGVKVNGSDNEFDGNFTYRCTPPDISGSGNDFDPPHQQQPNVQPSPITPPYTFDSFPCNVTFNSDVDLTSVNSLWMNNNPNTKVLKSQVICGRGKIDLSGQGISGTVTIVARGELVINGSDFNLTGLWNNIVLYSARSGDGAIKLSGSNGSWTGIIYAPNGQVEISGSDNTTIHGSVIASTIKLNGSNLTINADDDPGAGGGPPNIRLVE